MCMYMYWIGGDENRKKCIMKVDKKRCVEEAIGRSFPSLMISTKGLRHHIYNLLR